MGIGEFIKNVGYGYYYDNKYNPEKIIANIINRGLNCFDKPKECVEEYNRLYPIDDYSK